MTDKAIAKRIKQYRKQSGLTQDALADKAGLATNTIARVERGVHRPSSLTIEKLAKALGVKASDILDY
jgi:transcriptional regulator with XRE-family HTH domain